MTEEEWLVDMYNRLTKGSEQMIRSAMDVKATDKEAYHGFLAIAGAFDAIAGHIVKRLNVLDLSSD